MSNFNYMDDVPVKIAESYKPLPKVFQIPQAIANKLQLSTQHYHESPQYAYDFQLEKQVLAKMHEWRCMRQQEREQRRERMQRREEQRLRALEQQHKQMLGAVSYPDAEELSSESDTDEEVQQYECPTSSAAEVSTNGPATQGSLGEEINFDTILQPTILPQAHTKQHARNKSNSSFNYKDFEEDTSSPFDNIELKTINDLDILAQVLQHAQLKASNAKEDNDQPRQELEESSNNTEIKDNQSSPNNLDNELNDEVALERNDIQLAYQQQELQQQQQQQQQQLLLQQQQLLQQQNQSINIPNYFSNSIDYVPQHQGHPHQLSKQDFYAAYASNPQQHQQLTISYMQHYNQSQTPQHQHQSMLPLNQLQQQQLYTSNHNYLYSTGAVCNGGGGGGGSYSSPAHNANNYSAAAAFVSNYGCPSSNNSHSLNVTENVDSKIKAKSVPDILKELKDDLRNAEMRRVRNCSYRGDEEVKNGDGCKADLGHVEPMSHANTPTTTNAISPPPSSCYNNLEAEAQTLVKSISSMGFPLERVARIAEMFGADDKKIIAHLIPLTELLDLGFDESKISEALLRFDNNIQKALEDLIAE